jgi:hypothetical protein
MSSATSWRLVAASTKAGSRVIAPEIRTLLTSLPSAATWATPVSVMIPAGLAGLAVEDHQRRHR